jgi:hypothetical protein
MKISYLSIGALAGILAATSALAVPTVNISRTAGTYSGSGGEFTLKANADIFYTPYSATVPVFASGSTIQTFCLETSDYVTMGNNYSAYVDSKISGANGTKTLTVGAANLYAQFCAQTLGGYNYTVGSGRSTTAGQLQNTIWAYMGYAYSPNAQFASDLTAVGITTPTAAISGAYYETTIGQTIWDVAILNLGVNGNSSAQDQLVAWSRAKPNDTSVPDGGTTVSMLGMALAGLGFIARRFGTR